MTTLETIKQYYVQHNDASGPESYTISCIIEQIYDRMCEQDMPEQEIGSILLPINHPFNNAG